MSDRIQVDLRRTYNELLETLDEYKTLFNQHSRPWSKDVRIELESLLQLMQQSHKFILQALNKWEDMAKKTKDADIKKAEYEAFDQWRDDVEHRKVLKELTLTLLKGNEYLAETKNSLTEDVDSSSYSTDSTQIEHLTASPIPNIDIEKHFKTYDKLLNESKIVASVTDEQSNKFIFQPQRKNRNSWKYKPRKYTWN